MLEMAFAAFSGQSHCNDIFCKVSELIMLKQIQNTLSDLWSLVVGLKITGKELFKPWLTIHYPRNEVTNLKTYRGHIELVGLVNEPTIPRCIMCGKCAENCPSSCIAIEYHIVGNEPSSQNEKILIGVGVEIPFTGKKIPPADNIERSLDSFRLNYNYCSLCGLCVQNCPVGAIEFSRNSYLAGRERKDFEFDLIGRLKTHGRL
jgi:NADH-quinone oxidoreductase subunit I